MNDSVFEIVEESSQVLRLDFSSIEFAKLVEGQELSEAQIQAVAMVFEHLQRKKVETMIHTLLKMSRLPLKDPKTFLQLRYLQHPGYPKNPESGMDPPERQNSRNRTEH